MLGGGVALLYVQRHVVPLDRVAGVRQRVASCDGDVCSRLGVATIYVSVHPDGRQSGVRHRVVLVRSPAIEPGANVESRQVSSSSVRFSPVAARFSAR